MVMGGSSMPKADYDLMAIMYSAYDVITWKHSPQYCPFVRETTAHR